MAVTAAPGHRYEEGGYVPVDAMATNSRVGNIKIFDRLYSQTNWGFMCT